MDVDQYDDSQSDSGVSADFSLNSMSDTETPIEREIRLAFKRERSLRRSRGLDETKEFIEIPLRKSILTQNLPNNPAKDHGKERQFAGNKMQREIHAEAEREKVLVKLGRLPGFYDKGTVRQLHERKRLFEAFQESKDVQISSDRSAESINSMEMLFQNHSPLQPAEASSKALEISKNQDQETYKTVQNKPKNKDTPCVLSAKNLNGKNQDCSTKEQTGHTRLESSAQLFPSLKERKLWFESIQEKKDVQIFRHTDIEVPGSVKERRKGSDQNLGLKTVSESKSLQIKINQDDKTSGNSKEPTRNKVQKSKPSGPGFSEAVNQQVIIIENNPRTTPHTNGKVSRSVSTPSPAPEPEPGGVTAPAEKCQRNSALQNQTVNGQEVQENPFFKLRSSLLPDVKKDIQNTRTREEELRKQRSSLYGNRSKVTTSPSKTTSTNSHANTQEQNQNISPVSLSFGKLDLKWPPPSLQNGHKTQPEVKEQRQTNLLVKRWEARLINGHNTEHHN